MNPKKLTIKEIEELFSKQPKHFTEVDKLYTGKFTESDFWKGWTPSGKDEDALENLKTIEKAKNNENVIKGVVERKKYAIVGKLPYMKLQSLSTDKKDIEFWDEVNKIFWRWWDNKKLHNELKKYIHNIALHGKGCLRIYIPSGYFNQENKIALTGTSDIEKIENILKKICVISEEKEDFVEDFNKELGNKYTIVALDKEAKRYEVTYLDENHKTVLQIIESNEDKNPLTNIITQTENTENKVVRDLRGENLTYVFGNYDERMISPEVVSMQLSILQAMTHENLAMSNINFPETTITNAEEPEEKTTKGAVAKSKILRWLQGAGVTNFLRGISYYGANGEEIIATPTVSYREGIDPAKFTQIAEINKRRIHQQVGMLYVYLADSEYASGDSKVESMTDYLILLTTEKTNLDVTGVWLLKTVMNLVFSIMGEEKLQSAFKPIFETRITLGKISAEDKAQMLEEVKNGLRSVSSYIIDAGVNDDAELELKAVENEDFQPPQSDTKKTVL